MSFLKQHIFILIVLLLSYLTIQPLLSPGFFQVHDNTQVERVYEMKTALADGMFPVQWVPDLGYNYGYPIFNFYGPFAYYVGALFNLIGFDSLTATKLMIGLGTLIAGIFMYLFAREFWGRFGAIVSAMLYMYAPYHALNIYVRGAIGELWAYGILPLAFFALYKAYQSTISIQSQAVSKSKVKSQKSKLQLISQKSLWLWVSLSALSYAAIVVSHNLTAMMITPFLFTFAVLLYVLSRMHEYGQRSYFILLGLLIGISLSAFYWLPVFLEMKYTNVLSVVGGGSDYIDHFACLNQLWHSQWGYAGSGPGCLDGMSFKIGKLHIFLALLSLVPFVLLRSKKNIQLSILLPVLAVLFSTFLITEYSKFIWDAIPHMAFFQFPWRFLVMVSFLLSFIGGAFFLLFKKGWIAPGLLTLVIVTAIIFHYGKLFVPDRILSRNAADYTNKEHIAWTTSKISDEYMPPGFQTPGSLQEVPKRKIDEKPGVKFISYSEKTQVISAVVDAKQKTDLQVNVAYFPGWHVYIDGKQELFKYYKKGLIVTVPAGQHMVAIKYSQTTVEQIANALSLTGIFILLAGIISSRKEDYRV